MAITTKDLIDLTVISRKLADQTKLVQQAVDAHRAAGGTGRLGKNSGAEAILFFAVRLRTLRERICAELTARDNEEIDALVTAAATTLEAATEPEERIAMLQALVLAGE